MKKLLLILICLFVSFEGKSETIYEPEPDDLSGKKLVCESELSVTGFNFLDNTQVKTTNISKKDGNSFFLIVEYKTTPVEIVIDVISVIDRYTLRTWNGNECKLIEGNFDSYMDDRLEIIKNEIKSKRKI